MVDTTYPPVDGGISIDGYWLRVADRPGVVPERGSARDGYKEHQAGARYIEIFDKPRR
jgi:hypothetical protein